jgi:hypothetical protein
MLVWEIFLLAWHKTDSSVTEYRSVSIGVAATGRRQTATTPEIAGPVAPNRAWIGAMAASRRAGRMNVSVVIYN